MELFIDGWRKTGVDSEHNQSRRDVWYNRIYSGVAVMSIWAGLDNALITPDTMPLELAPVQQVLLQYPAWGQYLQTRGGAGTPPDLDWAKRLMEPFEDRKSVV